MEIDERLLVYANFNRGTFGKRFLEDDDDGESEISGFTNRQSPEVSSDLDRDKFIPLGTDQVGYNTYSRLRV